MYVVKFVSETGNLIKKIQTFIKDYSSLSHAFKEKMITHNIKLYVLQILLSSLLGIHVTMVTNPTGTS
jgi:hypothetical protein